MTAPVHITFIHGLANKPPMKDLRRLWLEALALDREDNTGFDLGNDNVDDAFVYWADLFYTTPLAVSDYESVGAELEASLRSARSELKEDAWVAAMRKVYPDAAESYPEPPVSEAAPAYERIPLPGFVKEAIMAEYLREAHAYLFDKDGARTVIRNRVLEILKSVPDGTRRVIVSHSQGTFIAYDVLTGCDDCPPVDGLMTFGSPLGVDEVQDKLKWTRENGFPAKLRGDWVNVYDPFDLVARPDPCLANDFRKNGLKAVIDVEESNWGRWRHSATKYFKGPKLRKHLRKLCGRELP